MATTYGTLTNIHLPQNIMELKDYVKRRLGHPVVKIDVTDEQFYDRIADTLQFYQDFHYNGSLRTYSKWQVTPQDIVNRYLTTSPNVLGVTRILDPRSAQSSMFTSVEFWLRSQINFFDFFGSTQASFVDYFLTQQRIADMDMLFRSNPNILFSRNDHRLFIEFDWQNDIRVGDWIVAEVHTFLDPQTSKDVLNERFILAHVTASVKMQWGENLKKFGGVPLPGGLTVNGDKIWQEGKDEKETIEKEYMSMILPPLDLIG